MIIEASHRNQRTLSRANLATLLHSIARNRQQRVKISSAMSLLATKGLLLTWASVEGLLLLVYTHRT